jgi:hypothetical protein
VKNAWALASKIAAHQPPTINDIRLRLTMITVDLIKLALC